MYNLQGLSLLAMSTPPVLSRYTGTCRAYKPDCIGDTQKALFYTALALIAVGRSGNLASAKSFTERQLKEIEPLVPDASYDDISKMMWKLFGWLALLFISIFGGIALLYIKPWSVRFGISAICTVAAVLVFISGSSSYAHDPPQGSPLTTVSRVFVASASKIFCSLPRDPNQLYEKHPPSDQALHLVPLPHTQSLRFNLALVDSNPFMTYYKYPNFI
jgi:peptide/histidine transporter 3/4